MKMVMITILNAMLNEDSPAGGGYPMNVTIPAIQRVLLIRWGHPLL